MVKFPTPSEVAAMQAKDQKEVVALVDCFVTFLMPTFATSRPNGFGETTIRVPSGFLKQGETWNQNHDEELRKRISAAGWQIVGRLYVDEKVLHANFTLKPKPTT